ncbi:MAG TPA: EamA family transporter [Steroidobacteraceae bacterium]|jgi:drug/metabolite transporter (DMT)-like permease|nr:EamA family transporter [Steroidobacteraceae bacterium]
MAFVALSIIWGFPYLLIKLAVGEVPPLMVAWARVTLAAGILLPLASMRGAPLFARGHFGALVAFALAEFVIPFAAISIGEQWISSSMAGILIATVPMWVVLLSRSFGVHERLGARRLAGLALGFAGVVTLLGFGGISGAKGWVGVGCLLVSALGYGVGPLIIQRHMKHLDAIGPLSASLAIASACLLVPALLEAPRHWPSATAIAAIASLGVVCTAVAMMLMFYLVNHAGASRASLITYLNPAVASLLGVTLLDERLGPMGVTAFGLILLGSWLATHRAQSKLVELAAER